MEIDRNNLDLDRKFPQQQSLKKIFILRKLQKHRLQQNY
jgi:hypothetical protein